MSSRPHFLNALAAKKPIFKLRSQLHSAVRTWMAAADFLELTTPILLAQSLPEPNITPLQVQFSAKTFTQTRSLQGFLRVSPEVSLKKFLAAGYERIYEYASVFRSHEDFASPLHNAEFTLLEWYRLNASLDKIADDLRKLLSYLTTTLLHSSYITVGTKRIACGYDDWEVCTIAEIFRRYTPIDFASLRCWEELPKRVARLASSAAAPHKNSSATAPAALITSPPKAISQHTPEEVFTWLFITHIEPHLPQEHGIILTHYPSFVASCSRLDPHNPRYALRWEAYLGGIELANAFDELTDAQIQQNRINAALPHLAVRETGDPNFITALNYIPQASGIALGIDRLLMLLAGERTLQAVLPFPTGALFGPSTTNNNN